MRKVQGLITYSALWDILSIFLGRIIIQTRGCSVSLYSPDDAAVENRVAECGVRGIYIQERGSIGVFAL